MEIQASAAPSDERSCLASSCTLVRVLTLCWALLGCGANVHQSGSQLIEDAGKTRVGHALPWFGGWSVDGKVLNRRNLLGSQPEGGRLIVFFATWCKPCEAGLLELVRARGQLEKAGVQLLLINFREESAKVVPWLRARSLGDAPVLLDQFGYTARDLAGVGGDAGSALPRTLVVGPDGRVRRIIGREGGDYVDLILRAARR